MSFPSCSLLFTNPLAGRHYLLKFMLITDNILFLKIRKAKSIVRCLVEQYPKSFLINSDNQYKTYTKANIHNYKQVLALGTNNEYKINQN